MKGSGSKLERKTIEKNRRILMKFLCFKLVSLIPPSHFNPPKEFLLQQDQIDQSISYIQKLSERVDELKRRKTKASRINPSNTNCSTSRSDSLPILKLRDLGSSLEVIVISGARLGFTLSRVVGVLEDEGAEVVTVSISNMGDKIFHTLHAQVRVARLGVDISTISGRLEELIFL